MTGFPVLSKIEKFQHRPDLPRTGSVSSSWSKASWKLKSSACGKNLICLVRVCGKPGGIAWQLRSATCRETIPFQWVQMSKSSISDPNQPLLKRWWRLHFQGCTATSVFCSPPWKWKAATTVIIFTKALPSKRGSLPRLRTRSRWSLARKTCESSVGAMSESPFLSD